MVFCTKKYGPILRCSSNNNKTHTDGKRRLVQRRGDADTRHKHPRVHKYEVPYNPFNMWLPQRGKRLKGKDMPCVCVSCHAEELFNDFINVTSGSCTCGRAPVRLRGKRIPSCDVRIALHPPREREEWPLNRYHRRFCLLSGLRNDGCIYKYSRALCCSSNMAPSVIIIRESPEPPIFLFRIIMLLLLLLLILRPPLSLSV